MTNNRDPSCPILTVHVLIIGGVVVLRGVSCMMEGLAIATDSLVLFGACHSFGLTSSLAILALLTVTALPYAPRASVMIGPELIIVVYSLY